METVLLWIAMQVHSQGLGQGEAIVKIQLRLKNYVQTCNGKD